MKPSIVIQTDFSLTWSAVAQMKGVMKRVDPTLDIVDLTHDIKPFDPWAASLSLAETEPWWPAGTIFVSVVDAGVGTSRRASCAKLKDGNTVITPDNGALTSLLHSVGIEAVREIDETRNRYAGRETVSVFHGRDIFGYCAARLAAGVITFEEVGPVYPIEEIIECPEYSVRPVLSQGCVSGFVMTGVRHFGGISFNITNAEFESCGFQRGEFMHVTIYNGNRKRFDDRVLYCDTFGDVEIGEPLLYRGSSGYLSMDLNQGNLMKQYELDTGISWKATIYREETEK